MNRIDTVSDPASSNKRRTNIRLAIALGVLALAFFVTFIASVASR